MTRLAATRHQLHTQHLWSRIAFAKQNLPAFQTSFRCVFEDPRFPDEPCRVLVPDQNWMAMAMHGDLLPPVSAYHTMRMLLVFRRAGVVVERENIGLFASDMRWRMVAEGWKFIGEKVLPGHTVHTAPVLQPMTEEEALYYLVEKDVPRHVWQEWRSGNRRLLALCHADQLPSDRRLRNAWRLCQ